MNNPTAAAKEILKRLDLTGPDDPGEAETESAHPGEEDTGPGPVEGGAPGGEGELSAAPGQGPSLSRVLRSYSGLRRAVHESPRLRGVPVLWVDGQPEERDAEAELLRTLGLHLVRALNVEEAFRRIDRQKSSPLGPFRAILSDLSRGSRWRPGTETVSRLSRTAPNTPIIVYVQALEGTIGVPKGAVAITDSPDELLHHLLDAVGRSAPLQRG
jgi:CheY-like chemotaxis protein